MFGSVSALEVSHRHRGLDEHAHPEIAVQAVIVLGVYFIYQRRTKVVAMTSVPRLSASTYRLIQRSIGTSARRQAMSLTVL